MVSPSFSTFISIPIEKIASVDWLYEDAVVNGEEFTGIPLEGMIRACGVKDVITASSYNQKELMLTTISLNSVE